MLPRLLTALIQNGAAIPTAAVISPPRAGPSARLMLMPTLFIATADDKSLRGTSSGMTDCQGGAVTAAPTPSAKTKNNSPKGVIRWSQTTMASFTAPVQSGDETSTGLATSRELETEPHL